MKPAANRSAPCCWESISSGSKRNVRRYDYFFDVVQQSTPDLVIVALDADRPKSLGHDLAAVGANIRSCRSSPISSDSQTLLQSLQRGARHFLSPPIGLEDLVATLRKVLAESGYIRGQAGIGQPPPAAKRNGMVISVIGSRGGVGCTSLAVNLAPRLAARPREHGRFARSRPGPRRRRHRHRSARQREHQPGRPGAEHRTAGYELSPPGDGQAPETGISVLRHPVELSEVSTIHEGHVERILNLAENQLLASGARPEQGSAAHRHYGVAHVGLILLVAQLELSSLRNVVRLVHTLSVEGDLGDRIRVIVNRAGSDHMEEGITIKKAEEVIGKPIFWQIPNDSKADADVAGGRHAADQLRSEVPAQA